MRRGEGMLGVSGVVRASEKGEMGLHMLSRERSARSGLRETSERLGELRGLRRAGRDPALGG